MHKTILILGFSLLLAASSFAQVDKFKAAYIFNICRFVEWPSTNTPDDFVIGVIDADAVKDELESLAASKKLFGKKIVVKEFASIAAYENCQVLYVGEAVSKRLPEAVVKVGTKHTLLVSEKEGSIERGAAINFLLQDKKLKFEIKTENAQRQGLKVNSSLNKLASKVY